MLRTGILILVLVLIPFVFGCEKKAQEHQYQEIVIKSGTSNMPVIPSMMGDDPHAGMDMNMPMGKDPHEGMDMNMPMGDDPHAGLDMNNIPPGMMNQASSQDSSLAWDVPKGWEEVPGSGMRVATFKLVGKSDEIDVSIVSLGGIAGGLESNLNRWAAQISLEIDARELDKFMTDAITVKTQSGVDAKVFDFTKLQKGQDPSSKSMIAAMVDIGDATVFVKMTGTIEAVTKNQDAFKSLTQSVHNK